MNHPSRQPPATPARPSAGRRLLRELRGYLEALAIAFVVVTFLFTTVGVVGSSMQPTLDGGKDPGHLLQAFFAGDRVFIPKASTWLRRAGVLGPYARGAIVVLREPRASPDYRIRRLQGCFESLLVDRCRPFFIKRVIARPGDTLSIRAGQVRVNGSAIDQGFVTAAGTVSVAPVEFPRVILHHGRAVAMEIGFEPTYGGVAYPVLPTVRRQTGFLPVDDPRVQHYYGSLLQQLVVPAGAPENVPVLAAFRIPKGHYFVMGDNRSSGGSEDSRYFGAIPAGDIAGRAAAVLWPPVRDGKLNWRLLPPPAAFAAVPPAGG